MREILKNMLGSLKNKKKVNKIVKDGLPQMEELLDSLAQLRKRTCVALRQREEAAVFQSPQPSTRAIVETAKGNPSGGDKKRAATTSPVLPANKETKKKKAKENGCTKVEPKRKKSGWAPVQNEIKEQATTPISVKGLRKKTKSNAFLINHIREEPMQILLQPCVTLSTLKKVALWFGRLGEPERVPP